MNLERILFFIMAIGSSVMTCALTYVAVAWLVDHTAGMIAAGFVCGGMLALTVAAMAGAGE